jgi:sodium transport system permease protein
LFGLLNVVVTVAGMGLAYVVAPSALTLGEEGGSISLFTAIPLPTLLMTLLLIILMSMMFNGIHVMISTYSRSMKEAGTYGSFIMIISYVPAFATMFMGANDMKSWMMFVPLLNTVASLKMLLAGSVDNVFMIGSLLSSLLFVVLILLVSRWLFDRETIMLRTT